MSKRILGWIVIGVFGFGLLYGIVGMTNGIDISEITSSIVALLMLYVGYRLIKAPIRVKNA